jgi:hypothetical protein
MTLWFSPTVHGDDLSSSISEDVPSLFNVILDVSELSKCSEAFNAAHALVCLLDVV